MPKEHYLRQVTPQEAIIKQINDNTKATMFTSRDEVSGKCLLMVLIFLLLLLYSHSLPTITVNIL